ELHNPYGITETCVDVSRWRCRRERRGEAVSLGTPMGNYQVYVLDDIHEPVGPRLRGEMHVGGEGVAYGYHDKPRRTARAFIPDPYDETPGATIYRSGDLARWDENGELRYLGRKDDQLQLRGIRVELGEIESHLEDAPGVHQAAVRAPDEQEGRAESLVAYVVPSGDRALSPEKLREHLKEHLREATVPGRYVELEELPRNPSGKVDRDALPEPDRILQGGDFDEPETETERKIAAIWKEVLEIDAVGRNVNFFELGGNSLAAVNIHRRLEQAFDRDLQVVDLFDYTSIRQLATFLDESSSSTSS
ncbi:MAG: phosphopantetheine-binding protein, partial [Bradymonadaceae bacterium]